MHALFSLVTVIDHMPPLSWLVDFSEKPRILVGRNVETAKVDGYTYVFEGCWDNDFDTRDYSTSANFFGSGFVARDCDFLFCTASHTLEALYICHRKAPNIYIVSNSLSFLVRYCSMSVIPTYNIYKHAHSIVKGIRSYDNVIYMNGGDTIYRLAYCNFSVSQDGIQTFDKDRPPRFSDFESYKTYLLNVLRGLRDNANSSTRLTKYKLLAALSTGYDSVACASLGAVVGCDGAITLRSGPRNVLDSGKTIAKMLGLQCIERDRARHSSNEELYIEAPFISSFEPTDYVFHVFGKDIRKSIIMTGHHGDMVWNPHMLPSREIKRVDSSGMGLHEFRLMNNCIMVPVPFIGAVNHHDIYSISHSAEMEPYRVGGRYDRPIPRRIAEEAGVPRKAFGQRKKAVNTALWWSEEKLISVEAERSIEEFVAESTGMRFWIIERMHRNMQQFLDRVLRLTCSICGSKEDYPLPNTLIGFTKRAARSLVFRIYDSYENASFYRSYTNYALIWALRKAGQRYPAGTGSNSLSSRVKNSPARG